MDSEVDGEVENVDMNEYVDSSHYADGGADSLSQDINDEDEELETQRIMQEFVSRTIQQHKHRENAVRKKSDQHNAYQHRRSLLSSSTNIREMLVWFFRMRKEIGQEAAALVALIGELSDATPARKSDTLNRTIIWLPCVSRVLIMCADCSDCMLARVLKLLSKSRSYLEHTQRSWRRISNNC